MLLLLKLAIAIASTTHHANPTPRQTTPLRPRCTTPLANSADDVTCEVRKQPKSSVALDISVPASVSKRVRDRVVTDFSKKAKVPGFRPGKAPKEALLNHVGLKRINKATVEQLIDVGMQQSGNQVQIQTVGEARLVGEVEDLAESYNDDQPLDFTVIVDVYPEVPLDESSYSKLGVDVEKVPFNQDAYDSALFKLRDQHADLVEDDVSAEEGMQLLVNMNGFESDGGSRGEPLPAVAGGEGVQLPMKAGKFMPGLVEGLVGVRKGESRDITVTFPARTSVPELAGKEAIFEVTCEKVQRRVLPETDDTFAKKVRSDLTWAELDAKLREGVEQECAEIQRKQTHRALERALIKTLPADFEVPETLLEEVSKERFAMMLSDLRERGTSDEQLKEYITPENYKKYLAISRPMSAMQVKADFSLKEICRQQGLSVPLDLIDDEVMTLQAQAVQRGEKFKESETRPKVEAQLERNMVLDWLAESATINLVEPGTLQETPEDILGANPEELAKEVAEASMDDTGATPPAAAAAAAPPPPAAQGDASAPSAPAGAPDGFEWGNTF